jgi:hypothetical protein
MIDRIDKPQAIICDVDGTVALMNGKRGPYEYEKAFEDEPNHVVIDMVLTMKKHYGCGLIMLSARENKEFHTGMFHDCYTLTSAWLDEYIGANNYDKLIMRKSGDYRKDAFVKFELGTELLKEWEVPMVFDDRNQVVDMWRNGLQLQCFQVADGNF